MLLGRTFLVNRLSIKAILYGTLVNMALDMLINIVLGSIMQAVTMRGAATAEEIGATAAAIRRSQPFLLAVLIFGTLSTAVGGYLTARLAKQAPLMNSFVFGVISVCIGLALSSQFNSLLRLNTVWYLFVIPAALAGGYLFVRTSKKDA